MRANGAFVADSTFLCLLFAVFTATAQVVRDHMSVEFCKRSEKTTLNMTRVTYVIHLPPYRPRYRRQEREGRPELVS